MASATTLKDIEDNFFECSVCLENFKEPKCLPCTHRYCKNCLKGEIEKYYDVFKCPLCNYICTIPPEGVEGFRTDVYMKSLLQYVRLQQTANTKGIQTECDGCSKQAHATSYCFKCKGFLCDQCHQFHMTLKMMQEHKPSVLSLKDIRERKLTLEKLFALTETPRCHAHVDKPAEVCCVTCSNLPICMVCGTIGKHKGHDLHDVQELAVAERMKMTKSLAGLESYKEKVFKLPDQIKDAEKQLNNNIIAKKETLTSQYNKESEKIKWKLEEIDDILEMNTTEINDVEKEEMADLETKRAKKIEKAVKNINDKYDKLIGEWKAKIRNMRDEQKYIHSKKRAKNLAKLEFLDKKFKDANKSVDIQGEQNFKEFETISVESANRIKRFENVWSSMSSILPSNNDWTDAQCLPDFSTAGVSLVEDFKKVFTEIESLPNITTGELPLVPVETVTITKVTESIIDTAGTEGWNICNVTTTDNGNIVISGDADGEHTHITCINTHGETIRPGAKRENIGEGFHVRKCSALTLFKVATTCIKGEVGIYNIHNGTYIKKDVSDVISSWGTDHGPPCVGTDHIKKEIFVGSYSKNVFIFDDKLNYLRTLKLPEMIQRFVDITLHEDNLLVCDIDGKRVCAFTKQGHEAGLVYELPKPNYEGQDWKPRRVCTDSNGFIYILWMTDISGRQERCLAQYSQDGRHLLITIPVDSNAIGISTLVTANTEKLLLVTSNTRKLYTCELITKGAQ